MANLESANLESSNLNFADLNETNLKSANLRKVGSLTCEQIKRAIINKKTKIPKHLEIVWKSENEFECRENYSNKILKEYNFKETDLSGSLIDNSDLEFANLRKANLFGADLRLTNLDSASFYNTDLRSANLQKTKNLTCNQLQIANVDSETILPNYLKISGGTQKIRDFQNKKIEVLIDYQCEETRSTNSK